MRKMYEIQADLDDLMEISGDRYVNGETGEILSREDFDALQMEWQDKVEGVALGFKNENAKAEAIETEIKKLKERMDQHKKRAEGYKAFLASVLEGKKFETGKVLVFYRKSEAIEIDPNIDVRDLPEQYLRYKDPEVNKTAIKQDIKAGKEVPGAALVVKSNIKIK